ncbi:MAG TPA: class I SAM-dependent methyltransferase [Planctomycetaceae bacterium]|nr:class I SAM-dependent methyltransferase [Planctomycetaceae bacterium]
MFHQLAEINKKPKPFEFYTSEQLWTNEHTSRKMLDFHLNDEIDLSSRHSQFIDRSVDWITSRFAVRKGVKVADFGCGPGLYSNRLARRGASVTGIDFSERSIRYAQTTAAREGLNVNYLQQNYLDSNLEGQFDLILMVMLDFCALSPSQRRCMLQKFCQSLAPDGSLLFDVCSSSSFENRNEVTGFGPNLLEGFWSDEPYYGFLNTFKYDDEKVVLDKYTIVEATRVRTIFNWMQYFTPETLEHELSKCGLCVDSLFADVAGTPYSHTGDEFAIVAKRETITV